MNIDTTRILGKGRGRFAGPVTIKLPGGPAFTANFISDPSGYDHELADIDAARTKAERRKDARRARRGRRGAVRVALVPDALTVNVIINAIALEELP